MKLKNSDLVSVYNGLAALDAGHQRVVKDGDRERVVMQEFDLTDNFVFAMAVNMNRLQEVIKALQKANADLVRRHSVDGKLSEAETPEAWTAYSEAREALEAKETEVELTRIARDELKLDKNKIKSSVIAMLMPIIVREDEKVAA